MVNHKESEISLTYRVLSGSYGYINGQWVWIVRPKYHIPIEVEFVADMYNDSYTKLLNSYNAIRGVMR